MIVIPFQYASARAHRNRVQHGWRAVYPISGPRVAAGSIRQGWSPLSRKGGDA